MRRAAVGAATLTLLASLTGCGGDPAKTACESYGGGYHANRWPACIGEIAYPTAYQRQTCRMIVAAKHGLSLDAAAGYC